MPKVRTTAKSIRELPEPKVSVGYCDLQTLLKFRHPFAYTAGTYGWNFDAYDLDGLILTTGYRGTIGPNVYDMAHRYEEMAEDFRAGHLCDWEAQRSEFERLIADFRAELLASI